MKVKNLFAENKECANESSESGTKRLATQSQYQRQKIANELAECREKRLFNQCQYQKEKVKHRHAKRVRVIFLVIGVFVELFTVMIWLSFFWLRCTARRKLEIYNL